ncbi:hypothetical protein HYC85_021359 [Camellia sinensis]|uniref:Protein kinase domain-containing protein n=1 Tax=Camellia sinensis TaxID=4442 RepID=A0A7J7GHF6_CAMSI|nr:hypothetical protein HYC85_021359 [Camellia sinensis]
MPPSCWKAPQAAGNGVVVVMLGGDEEKVVVIVLYGEYLTFCNMCFVWLTDCQLHSRTCGWNWFIRCCLPSKMPRDEEIVTIKNVLQDKRYKNRELQIVKMMNHPNVVVLKHCH